jgi:hypothetical protein
MIDRATAQADALSNQHKLILTAAVVCCTVALEARCVEVVAAMPQVHLNIRAIIEKTLEHSFSTLTHKLHSAPAKCQDQRTRTQPANTNNRQLHLTAAHPQPNPKATKQLALYIALAHGCMRA